MSEFDGYYLYHSIGQYPDKQDRLTKALTDFAEQWSAGGDAQWHYAEAIEQAYLKNWARLLNAPLGAVAHAESVTSAVHAVLTSLPERYLRGKRVVMPADSFPSLIFLFQGMAERYGYALDLVGLREGAHWVDCDDIAERIDPSVGLVMLNWVSSTSSHKCNAPWLTELAHAAGALVGIDLTQGAGILPFDVSQTPVDFAATTSLKWIGGVPGAGILYVKPKITALCTPERRGWFSQENPFNWAVDDFTLASDARKFHLATPAALGFVGTLPALEYTLSGGMAAARQANTAIVAKLIPMLHGLDLEICTPLPEDRRGASLMVRIPEQFEAANLLAALKERGIFADMRGAILRLSPGILTAESSVLDLGACLSEELGRP